MACKREDRFRHNTIAFWLSDEEKAEVEAKIILSGVPKGEYYRKSVLEQEIKVVSGNYMSFRLSKVLERIYEEFIHFWEAVFERIIYFAFLMEKTIILFTSEH